MRLVCCSIIVMSLALTIVSEAEVNLDTAVGIWLLDEGAGQVAKDSSANGNDGELIKKPKWVDGKLGKSLEFDGTNYINCGHDESFNLTDEISIIAWAKMKDPTEKQDIIAKDFAGGTSIGAVNREIGIGAHFIENWGQYFTGLLDDVAFFDVTLTAADIKNIMNKGLKISLSVSAAGKLATSWGSLKAQY